MRLWRHVPQAGEGTLPSLRQMKQNDDMLKERAWTPYREVMRYRRLLIGSVLVNLILAAALLHCLR